MPCQQGDCLPCLPLKLIYIVVIFVGRSQKYIQLDTHEWSMKENPPSTGHLFDHLYKSWSNEPFYKINGTEA